MPIDTRPSGILGYSQNLNQVNYPRNVARGGMQLPSYRMYGAPGVSQAPTGWKPPPTTQSGPGGFGGVEDYLRNYGKVMGSPTNAPYGGGGMSQGPINTGPYNMGNLRNYFPPSQSPNQPNETVWNPPPITPGSLINTGPTETNTRVPNQTNLFTSINPSGRSGMFGGRLGYGGAGQATPRMRTRY